MAGYAGYSMSNNAIAAEYRGLFVASKVAQKLRRFKSFKGITASDVAEVLQAEEWHHTSKFYNRTNYYNYAEELSYQSIREELRETVQLRKEFRSLKKKLADKKGNIEIILKHPDELKVWYTITKGRRPVDADITRMKLQAERGYAYEVDDNYHIVD